ncbi:hypothetical protein DVH24_029658 [Malus domestica]|uniref:WW domain-containing protein n=1 Tax=Malus domestica TaxID=3750 RepID=A0A498HZA6_MALDO|nr:hypothetical protein DVH24_029658 [Malus domestica]
MQEIKRCPHQRLKVVRFSGFIGMGGSIIDKEFAMYLMENAVVLEKFFMDLEKSVTTEEKLEATKEHALQLIGTQLPPGAELDPTLPPPWRRVFDGNNGVLYYWHPETNVSQYEEPVHYPTHSIGVHRIPHSYAVVL